MTKKKEPDEFTCSKCKVKFRGLDSFHGEYRVMRGDVLNVQLCLKCLYETVSSWNGEFDIFRAQIEREKENCIRQHKIDRNADAKRIVYEKMLDLIDNSIMFNGYNEHSGYRKDKSSMELQARRIIHGDCKVNFEEQVQLTNRSHYSYVVDGLILGKKPVVLEFDSAYWHSTPEQKEYDNRKDVMLSEYGGYRVQRIPQRVIENDKSRLMTLLLNALYNVKNNSKKTELPTQVSAQPPPS